MNIMFENSIVDESHIMNNYPKVEEMKHKGITLSDKKLFEDINCLLDTNLEIVTISLDKIQKKIKGAEYLVFYYNDALQIAIKYYYNISSDLCADSEIKDEELSQYSNENVEINKRKIFTNQTIEMNGEVILFADFVNGFTKICQNIIPQKNVPMPKSNSVNDIAQQAINLTTLNLIERNESNNQNKIMQFNLQMAEDNYKRAVDNLNAHIKIFAIEKEQTNMIISTINKIKKIINIPIHDVDNLFIKDVQLLNHFSILKKDIEEYFILTKEYEKNFVMIIDSINITKQIWKMQPYIPCCNIVVPCPLYHWNQISRSNDFCYCQIFIDEENACPVCIMNIMCRNKNCLLNKKSLNKKLMQLSILFINTCDSLFLNHSDLSIDEILSINKIPPTNKIMAIDIMPIDIMTITHMYHYMEIMSNDWNKILQREIDFLKGICNDNDEINKITLASSLRFKHDVAYLVTYFNSRFLALNDLFVKFASLNFKKDLSLSNYKKCGRAFIELLNVHYCNIFDIINLYQPSCDNGSCFGDTIFGRIYPIFNTRELQLFNKYICYYIFLNTTYPKFINNAKHVNLSFDNDFISQINEYIKISKYILHTDIRYLQASSKMINHKEKYKIVMKDLENYVDDSFL